MSLILYRLTDGDVVSATSGAKDAEIEIAKKEQRMAFLIARGLMTGHITKKDIDSLPSYKYEEVVEVKEESGPYFNDDDTDDGSIIWNADVETNLPSMSANNQADLFDDDIPVYLPTPTLTIPAKVPRRIRDKSTSDEDDEDLIPDKKPGPKSRTSLPPKPRPKYLRPPTPRPLSASEKEKSVQYNKPSNFSKEAATTSVQPSTSSSSTNPKVKKNPPDDTTEKVIQETTKEKPNTGPSTENINGVKSEKTLVNGQVKPTVKKGPKLSPKKMNETINLDDEDDGVIDPDEETDTDVDSLSDDSETEKKTSPRKSPTKKSPIKKRKKVTIESDDDDDNNYRSAPDDDSFFDSPKTNGEIPVIEPNPALFDDNQDGDVDLNRKKTVPNKKVVVNGDAHDPSGSDEEEKPEVKERKKRGRRKGSESDSSVFEISSEDDEDDDDDDSEDLYVSDEEEVVASKSKSGDEESDEESGSKKKTGPKSKTRTKRKRSSVDSDDGGNKFKKRTQRKQRKRVKAMDSDSDEKTASDQEVEKKSPKKPKKILTDKELDAATQKANKAEMERRKRIEERQRLYNKLDKDVGEEDMEVEVEAGPSTSSPKKDRRVVLEYDSKTKEVVIEVHPTLAHFLKSHQIKGVKFLYESTIESVNLINKPGSGCILAHSMGLGKTLQIVSFIHTIMTNPSTKEHLRCFLVICPKNTVKNWVNEFNIWLFEKNLADFIVHDLEVHTQPRDRLTTLKQWHEYGGVLIIGITLFTKLVLDALPEDQVDMKKGKKKRSNPNTPFNKGVRECLVEPGPDFVIIDEGHLLKNDSSQFNRALTPITTKRRIILTGTPLQNNLTEYFVMVDFVKPRLLGSKREFSNRFANPIAHGQHEDSTPQQVNIMKKRSHVLHKLLDACVQRMDYSILAESLSPKHEYVIKVNLTDIQAKLYQHYMEHFAQGGLIGKETIQKVMGKGFLFKDWFAFQIISAHPHLLEQFARRAIERKLDKEDDFINDGSDDGTSNEDEAMDVDDNSNSNSNPGPSKPTKKRVTRSAKAKGEASPSAMSPDFPTDDYWYRQYIPEFKDDEVDKMIEISGKTTLLFEILSMCERIGDKLIVFSQSLDTLEFIEEVLAKIHRINFFHRPEGSDLRNTWIKDTDYFKLDGQTSSDKRKLHTNKFNDPKNLRARLFLISTKAGSLGINLVGANRCIIFDASWNPTHDVQAIFRIYRFGQTKPIYVYRFVSKGTMEERIYDRQIIKQALSCRVIDEQQIVRHFKEDEIQALYQFNPNRKSDRVPPVPKDRLLADLMLSDKTKWLIFDYHEHDSLLEDRPEEKLTDEERKQAWEEFEREKQPPPPPPQRTTQMIIEEQIQKIREYVPRADHATLLQIHAGLMAYQREFVEKFRQANQIYLGIFNDPQLGLFIKKIVGQLYPLGKPPPPSQPKPIDQRTVVELDFPCLFGHVRGKFPNQPLGLVYDECISFIDQQILGVRNRRDTEGVLNPNLLVQLEKDVNHLNVLKHQVQKKKDLFDQAEAAARQKQEQMSRLFEALNPETILRQQDSIALQQQLSQVD